MSLSFPEDGTGLLGAQAAAPVEAWGGPGARRGARYFCNIRRGLKEGGPHVKHVSCVPHRVMPRTPHVYLLFPIHIYTLTLGSHLCPSTASLEAAHVLRWSLSTGHRVAITPFRVRPRSRVGARRPRCRSLAEDGAGEPAPPPCTSPSRVLPQVRALPPRRLRAELCAAGLPLTIPSPPRPAAVLWPRRGRCLPPRSAGTSPASLCLQVAGTEPRVRRPLQSKVSLWEGPRSGLQSQAGASRRPSPGRRVACS